MKALILAAGQGTRLRYLTEERPKPMLPIRGKPLLQYTVEWLRRYGISDIAINVHYRPDLIMRYFDTGACWDVSIRYSHESQLVGTAGAAKRLESFLDEDFVVIYGDVLTNLDLMRLISFHHQQEMNGQEAPAVSLALYRVPDPTQCGLVETGKAGNITRFVEKPALNQVFTDLAFSGIMVCKPRIFTCIPQDTLFDFGHDLFPVLLSTGVPMYAQPIAEDEYVIDIGTLPGYLAALRVPLQPT